MKILDIAIYMFCVFGAIGFFAGSTLFGGVTGWYVTQTGSFDASTIVSGLNPPDASTTYEEGSIFGSIGVTFNGISALIGIFAMALDLGGFLYAILPFLNVDMCNFITAVVDLTYVVGIVDYMLNRSSDTVGGMG